MWRGVAWRLFAGSAGRRVMKEMARGEIRDVGTLKISLQSIGVMLMELSVFSDVAGRQQNHQGCRDPTYIRAHRTILGGSRQHSAAYWQRLRMYHTTASTEENSSCILFSTVQVVSTRHLTPTFRSMWQQTSITP